MARLELVTGPMRAGKTTYATRKAGEGWGFISFDLLMDHQHDDLDQAIRVIAERVGVRPAGDWIMDGWFSIHNQGEESTRRLQRLVPQTVTLTGFYAPMADLLGRIDQLHEASRPYQTHGHILDVYAHLWRMYTDELADVPFIWRTAMEGEISASTWRRRVREDAVTATPADVEAFVQRLQARRYHTNYQTIRLPHGRVLPSQAEPTEDLATQILENVAVRGKSVLDAGCYHGELLFACEDAGARETVGIDATHEALGTAVELAALWGYGTTFWHRDLDAYEPERIYDLVACCNTLQYVREPACVVARLFAAGATVIWETYADAFPLLDAQVTHRLVWEEESRRWRPPSPKPRYLRIYERIAA